MMMEYFAIYGSSMLKFIAGPLIGAASGLSFWQTALLTAGGMMTTVGIFVWAGHPLRKYLIQRFGSGKKFSPRNRRFVKVWGKYGLPGLAIITPLILSPMVGSMIATGLGGKPSRIMIWMGISAVVWAFIFSSSLPFVLHLIKDFLPL